VYLLVLAGDTIETWTHFLNDYLLPSLASTLAATLAIARFDGPLAALFLVVGATLLGLLVGARRTCCGHAHAHATRVGALHARLEETLRQSTAIHAADAVEHELADLRARTCPAAYGAYHDTARCARPFQRWVVPVVLLYVLAFLWRSDRLLRRAAPPPSRDGFVAAFLVLVGLTPTVLWISETIGQAVLDVGHVSHLDAVLEPAPVLPRDQEVLPMPAAPPAEYFAGLVDVTFGYGGDTERGVAVLRGVTLGFRRGVCTALVGPVGAGKSTVLRLLLGCCVPTPGGGDCYADGRWYRELGAAGVRRLVGWVPQEPVLFAGTVLHNVRYGHEEAVDAATAADFVRRHGGAALAARLDDDVGPGGGRLSGGQRQLVWCLRLLLRPPPLLLLDEPTAAMDAASRDALMALLATLMHDRTTVVVSHDPLLLRHAHTTVELRSTTG
jgi:ABC-type multidrug transport system fused ATPase/permease subunit